MTSLLEKRMQWFSRHSFGPDDPRTASLDHSGLSFENEAKLLEAELRNKLFIESERKRSAEERRVYWSDRDHLSEKLKGTIQSIAEQTGVQPAAIAGQYSIVWGTGEVVTQTDDSLYHFVEILPEGIMHIYEKVSLPRRSERFIRTSSVLGLTF